MLLSEKLTKILTTKGITAYRVSKETGIPYTTLTKILNGSTKSPRVDIIKTLAAYLGESVDDLTEQSEEKEAPYFALNEKDEKDIAKELERVMNDLESNSSLAFMGEPIDEHDRELLRISLENTLRMHREMAKKKYTPKKYRK